MFLDFVVVAVMALSAIYGFLKGFIKSIFGLLSTLVSAFLASQLAQMLAPTLSERITEVGMKSAFLTIIPDVDLTGIPTTIESVTLALQEYGLPGWMVNTVAGHITQQVENGAATAGEQLRETIAEGMAQAVSLSFTHMLLFVILFFVLLAVMQIIMLLLDTVFKLPLLNMANRLGGMAMGLVQGALICGVVCVIVSLILLYTAGDPDAMLTMESVKSTYLFHHFYDNPIIEMFLFQSAG